jgi:hypothetical protein
MNADTIAAVLNEAYKLDPVAVRSLLCYQVPVNKELADHRSIIVRECEEGWAMTFLGLLNGLLENKGAVATMWSDEPIDESGTYKFLGFTALKSTIEI